MPVRPQEEREQAGRRVFLHKSGAGAKNSKSTIYGFAAYGVCGPYVCGGDPVKPQAPRYDNVQHFEAVLGSIAACDLRRTAMYKNSEGYPDPTAGMAYNNMQREQRQPVQLVVGFFLDFPVLIENDKELGQHDNHVRDLLDDVGVGLRRLIPVLKQTAELAGFEVVGRITLRDKETGREYR